MTPLTQFIVQSHKLLSFTFILACHLSTGGSLLYRYPWLNITGIFTDAVYLLPRGHTRRIATSYVPEILCGLSALRKSARKYRPAPNWRHGCTLYTKVFFCCLIKDTIGCTLAGSSVGTYAGNPCGWACCSRSTRALLPPPDRRC